MVNITQLNVAVMKQLRTDIDETLSSTVAKRYGIKLQLGKGFWTSSNATFKLVVSIINPDGSIQTKEADDFKLNASRFGLKPEDLGAVFQASGKTFILTGMNSNRPKFPFVAKCKENGKQYKLTTTTVTRNLKSRS